ncbi:MAG: FG-GAP-like repeat-containing protein, partial [Anaerolineae bacterium]
MVPRFAVVCVSASLVCLLPLAAQPLDLADAHEGGGAAIGSWLSLAQEQIRSSEYHFALRSGPVANGLPPGYHAPNRAHDLRIGVSTDGVHVVSRTGDPGDWHWSVAVGEAAHGGAAVFASEAAATLSRPGLDVRVVNAMDGIEHVLAPSEAFTTDSEGKRFAARLAFDTDLAAHQVSGTALEFQRDGRPVLRYEIEGAAHAMGSPAGASLRLVEGGAATVAVVEARTDDAAGPLEVRARVTGLGGAHNWSGLGGQAWSGYGWSVATAGDVNGDGYSEVLVGASGYDEGMLDEGRVFLYRGSATGLASSADWTAGVGVEFAYFGASVATAGDVNADGYSDVIVGAPGAERVPGTHRKGAAYLWYGGASGLGPNGTLANADRELVASEVYEMFGRSVATAGDVDGDGYSDVVVGAPQDDQLSGGYGRVYLYKGAAFGLQVSHSWLEVSTEYADHFGASVATAGDVNGDGYSDLVIGAPFADYGGYSSSGAAYVYLGGPDVPADTAQMTWGPSDEAAQAGLGVSTAGDVNGDGYSDVLIGAPWFGVTPEETGAVFLMLGSSGGVLSTPTWSAKGDVARGWFGSGVATAGDVNGDGYGDILVGQQLGDRAYVWQGDADGLGPFGTTSNADWTGYGPSGTDYGARVATAGDVNGDGYSDVIVGAPGLTQVETEEGAAFLYYGGPGELADEPDWYRNIGQEGADLGFSVASAGDVNGDGYADVIAGAPGYDSGYPDEGMAMVYHGSAEGPIGSVSVLPIWRALGGQAGAAFGTSVASAGDVNGDGYSDVIVGAPEYDSGQSDEGAAFVWHGWSTGLQGDAGTVALANWSAQGDQADSGFGGAVASAGDVNGDGYADVAVGAKDFDFPEMDEGAVFVWHGSNAGLGDPGTPANSDWREDGDTDDASLGNSVASAGDVNRDGFSDLIAGGAYFAATWHGSSSGLGTAGVDWVKAGSQSTALFGYSVSSAGDVNGDGYSDVVIGAPLQTGSQSNEGAAWAYCGSPAGLASTACWADVGGLSLSAFGWSVSPAGDLDGDGFADIAVGAPGWTNGELAEGQVRVYYGSAWGPVSYSGGDWVYESDTAYANLGYSVAGVGDVTGEGFGDLMVGAPRQEFLGSQQGTVHVFYGGGGIGRQVLPRQTTTD